MCYSVEWVQCVVKDGMIELYIGDLKRAREPYYLYSETATYDGSGKGIKGNNTKGGRKKMRGKQNSIFAQLIEQ